MHAGPAHHHRLQSSAPSGLGRLNPSARLHLCARPALPRAAPRCTQEVDAAAQRLGCSATTLKLACRALGIKRWPQRKLASLEHLAGEISLADELSEAQKQVRQAAGVGGAAAAVCARMRVRARACVVRACMRARVRFALRGGVPACTRMHG